MLASEAIIYMANDVSLGPGGAGARRGTHHDGNGIYSERYKLLGVQEGGTLRCFLLGRLSAGWS